MAVSFSTENMSPPPLLTDFYQVTMCYGYWKAGIHDEPACFELFFRKNPFHGEFTIFGGLDDCLEFVQRFKYSETDIEFLRSVLPPSTEEKFFEYLSSLNCNSLKIYGIKEGTVVFPKVPLISVEGPLAICQLLETTFLNLINFSSLVATNAARFRLAAGPNVELLEFGLRRAQGPNGGLTASKYCYMGGFDATSNLLAGKLFNIPVKGTQAHSFICSFSSAADMKIREVASKKTGEIVNFFELCKNKLKEIVDSFNWGVSLPEISEGELAAFCAYAIAFPDTFLALIDTYDVLRSGVINFITVSLVLHDLGYRALGCRIDSGDLSYLSKEIRVRFKQIAEMNPDLKWFALMKIIASNDINEETIMSLNEQQHEITSFGVGTHLVTCQKQPALGCVYKLVAVSGQPKIKLSQEVVKITIPGRKKCYRLYSKDGRCLLDLLTLDDEQPPEINHPILCRHPFEEGKRAFANPGRVEALHDLVWSDGKIVCDRPTLLEMKKRVTQTLNELRGDHKRYLNPTPYKVSVSEKLYQFLHAFWLQNAPIGQLE